MNTDNKSIESINEQNSDRFLAAITLTESEPLLFDRSFTAVPQYVPWPKAYGGDTVAQAAASAIATVNDDRELHSLHSSFLRPVDIGVPVRYEVEIVRDGRGFSTRHIRGIQHEKVAFMSTASFQVPVAGPRVAPAMPDVPSAEELPSAAVYLEQVQDTTQTANNYWAFGRSFDMRHVPGPVYIDVEGEKTPHQAIWVRAFDSLENDPRLHQIAISYVCDYTILEPSLRALDLNWSSPNLMTASLDHAMWFHNEARADEWLLYTQEAVGVQSARGLNMGRFFTSDGTLVATVLQEGLIRQG